MTCPYLKIDPIARCLAYDGIRIVRDNELNKFCQTRRYADCHVYLNKTAIELESGGLDSGKENSH